jgi:hypothetical protein
MQLQYVPMLRAIGAALAAFELPLLSNETWYGGAIAGEYQHGALSVPHALLCLTLGGLKLSPAGTALGVTLSYVALTAAGAFRLARRFTLPIPLAAAVACIAALNGFNLVWSSWLPALTGFAWVPWVWWALDRTLRPPRPGQGQVPLAFAVHGLLAAGWHFAVLMGALVVFYTLVCERGQKTFGSALKLSAPPLIAGALLSVPALACLVEYTRGAVRTDFDQTSSMWTVPLAALEGLVAPRSLSTWNVFGRLELLPNVALANGVLPILILPGALLALPSAERRRLVPLLAFALFVLVISLLPSFSRVRWSFRWLPLFHLLLGLVVALSLGRRQGIASVATGSRVVRIATAPLVLALVALLLILSTQPPDTGLLAGAFVTLVSAAAYELGQRYDRVPAAFGVAVALNLLASPLAGPPRDATPRWNFEPCSERLGTVGRGRRHIGIYTEGTIINPAERPLGPVRGEFACLLPGNSGMLFERPFVNGYSPVFPSGFYEILGASVHGNIERDAAFRLLGPWGEAGSLLDRWGVEFLTVPELPDHLPGLERAGFRREADLGGAWLFGRPKSAPPPVLESVVPESSAKSVLETRSKLVANAGRAWVYTGSTARFAPLASLVPGSISALRVEAKVSAAPGSNPGLVLLRRAYFPGYRALLDGEPLRVGRADGVFVAVEVPPGKSGTLVVEYRPLGVRALGLAAFCLGILGLIALHLNTKLLSPTSK